MKNHRLLWMILLALGYVTVAAINREYSWAWGRAWVAPIMTLVVLTATLAWGVPARRVRGCA